MNAARPTKPVALLLTLSLAGLAPISAANAKDGTVKPAALASIQPGMTRAQTLEKVGPPGNRAFSGEVEALQYCKKKSVIATYDEYMTIFLKRDRVVGLTNDRKVRWSLPCSGYPAVDWTAAPR